MKHKEVIDLLIRYIILIAIAIPNLYIIYAIFTPLTVYTVYYILSLIGNATLLEGNTIFFQGEYIELISACIAGAAYYLLLILNLSTPLKLKKRIYSLLFILIAFLILNIFRIVLFSILIVNGFEYFDVTHKLVWYAGSTILLIAIWFINIHIFKIKQIPVYTDLRSIYKDIKLKKQIRSSRKKKY